MTTKQSYVGRVSNATDIPQTAQNVDSAQAEPDDRQLWQIADAQTRLLETVDRFYQDAGTESVSIINDLLYRWLVDPDTNLKLQANRDQLFHALLTVTFLTKLNECNLHVELAGKEVGNV